MDWNEETIGRLRQFWTEGHSTAEIGRRMGVSKNAVVGKAHRLELAARPSPIRRDVAGSPRTRMPALKRVVGSTLPSFAGAVEPAPAVRSEMAEITPSSAPTPPVAFRPAPVAPAILPAPPLRAVATRSSRSVACCWPIGEPGTKAFRFCDAAAAAGKPYCQEHAQIAYVKVRERREEAA